MRRAEIERGIILGMDLDTVAIHARGRIERTLPFWPAPAIEAVQRRRVSRMVRHAYESVPFYRQAMEERGLRPDDFKEVADLERLPLIDAEVVQRQPSLFLARDGRDSQADVVCYTSGTSSGVRREVFWDQAAVRGGFAQLERAWPVVLKLAGESRTQLLLRDLLGEHRREVVLGAFRTGAGERLVWITRAETLARQQALRQGRSDPYRHAQAVSPLLPLPEAARRIAELRPRIVISFGSYADHFLRHAASARAEVYLPRVWAYTGDGVSATAHQVATERGCALWSSYNVTEVGRVGFQCERTHGHHLNVDLTPVRVIDAEGVTVAPGDSGELVVSSLRNRALVLLNYRLGDLGVMSPRRCACGRTLPLLAALHGRRSELLDIGDGRKLPSLSLEGMLRDELRSVIKTQIAQTRPGWITWRLVPHEGADVAALRTVVARRTRELLGDGIDVDVELLDDIPQSPDGKLQRVARPAP
jgi:phenylacetate-CoA ligase